MRSQSTTPGALRRILKVLLYLAVFVLVPLLVGVVNFGSKWNSEGQSADAPAYASPLPAPASYDPAKKIAVVLSSSYGAEINDFLPTYEILAASETFNTYVLAPERKPLPLVNSSMAATSLDFVPHFSFDEYAKTIGKTPDLIAVPYFPFYTAERDAAVVQWLRANTGPSTTLLGICIGSATLADTGLMAGHTATTNLGVYDNLSSRFTNVKWVKGVRYVDDGKLITSTNLASGIDATLRTVSDLAGRTTAEDVARKLGYRYTYYLDDPSWEAPTVSSFLTPIFANAAYQPGREEMGVLLYNGVSEMALSGLLDPYTSAMVAKSYVFAPEQKPVTSRNGLVFVPRFDFSTVPSLDRVVLPGGDATASAQQAVNTWSTSHPALPVQEIHREVGVGGSAYDLTLLDMARKQNAIVAAAAGHVLFYPTDQLSFDGAGWPIAPIVAPIALGLLAVAFVYSLGRRRRPPEVRTEVPRAA